MTPLKHPPFPSFPQDPAHGNGTCEQCGQPCAVCGPRWCPGCYYLDDGREREAVSPDWTVASPLIPCPYHVACQGYMDPMNPTQDNVCPACFEALCESHEEAEVAEYEEQLRAEARGEMFVPRWEHLPSTKRAEAALRVTPAPDATDSKGNPPCHPC